LSHELRAADVAAANGGIRSIDLSTAIFWLVPAVLLIALSLYAYADLYPFDTAFLISAGRMWSAGLNPYGSDFAAYGAPYISSELAFWVYPPQWWPIATALGALDTRVAVMAWKAVNLVVIPVAGVLLLHVFDAWRTGNGRALAACFAAVLLTTDATQLTVRLGQTSGLTAIGFALLLSGLKSSGLARQSIGLALLLLKPQFGLLYLLLMLARREGRLPAAAALFITALASAPLLLTSGFHDTIQAMADWLSNLAAYRELPFNGPGELTGFSYLLAWLGVGAPSPILCVLASWLATLCMVRPSGTEDSRSLAIRRCVVGMSVSLVLVPLHYYDFILLPAFLLLIPQLKPWAGWMVIFANIVAWRGCSTGFEIFMHRTSDLFPGALIGSILQAGTATAAGLLILAALMGGRRVRTMSA
jgi:hypothetical protein